MAKKPKTKTVSPDDAALFEQAVGNTKRLEQRHATPEDLGTIKDLPVVMEPEGNAPRRKSSAPSGPTRKTELPALETGATPGIDKRTAQRLKRGKMVIDGRLDLHGMTQDQAHGALERFLSTSQLRGRRCVIVITGKGYKARDEGGSFREQTGVLKQAVPRWLNEQPNRSRVLSFTQALQQDGGSGALYVYIKRLK